MYSTAHRLGDMRRLVRGTAAALPGYGGRYAEVYPTGPYRKGGQPYGPNASLPGPVDERNNALYDVSACDPNTP